MEKNNTLAMLADDVGISRSSLSLSVRGETVTVTALIQLLRALGKLDFINGFLTPPQKSPLLLAELGRKWRRHRVSIRKNDPEDDPKILPNGNYVDKLSLYLLLKDHEYERIQGELEQMINENGWSED